MYKYLEKINSPQELRQLSVSELETLAAEIRDFIIDKVGVNGGHLASNLGVVETTIALHYVFDFKTDHLLWDVGHQCYTHKILTGRREGFDKLRKEDGVSGFPQPTESEYDRFEVGHAGTSIGTALGMGLASIQNKTDEKIVALVGDGSIVNGASLEAINNLQSLNRQMLVVLNDNSMSIDVTQGAVAEIFSRMRLNHTYEELVRTSKNILEHVPLIGKAVDGALERFKKTIRMALPASRLFESMNLAYFGPVDGHDIGSLIRLFKALKDLKHPAVLHVYTRKGKGYEPADTNPSKFHSTGPFCQDGNCKPSCGKSYTGVFGEALAQIASEDEKITAITAAMPDGTGLNKFRELFPDRYYDVGIAESAAVDIAAGMAKSGLKPFVCIYSTFFQRSFDQIAHEVSLQDLPVVLCIDRAGVVGYDGATHHGLLDIGFLRMLPNMVVLAPACEAEMHSALRYAANCGKPVALRYPRDSVCVEMQQKYPQLNEPFEYGKCMPLTQNDADTVIVSYGTMLSRAVNAAQLLEQENIKIDVINTRFAKPIDQYIVDIAKKGKNIIVLEEHSIACGLGSAILEEISSQTGEIKGKFKIIGGPDSYIKKASRDVQLNDMGMSPEAIAEMIKSF
ncbi:MAG: 1-deoxy-D-xylulose-5-phosphate synthase [Sedimentisphaeraceae bacterium JB056]